MKIKPFRLIQLLSAFSNDEIKGLNRFVQATYFNTDKYVAKLLDVLTKDVIGKRTFDEAVQWRVYDKVFDKSPDSQEKLDEKEKKLLGAKMSALTKLAKDFLTIEALKEDKTYRNDLLLSDLLKKRQFDLFQSVIKKERKKLETEQERGVAYHQHEYMIERKTLDYLLLNRSLLVKNDNLMALNRSLDIHYLLDKLELHIAAVGIISSLGEKNYDFSSIEAIENLLDLVQYQGHPLIKIYRVAIKMMETQKHKNYELLLELLETQSQYIPKDNALDFYIMATNFCLSGIRSGFLEYHKYIFELYKVMENKDLLREGNFIPINKLKNVIVASCHIKEFEWAEYIIEKYRPYMPKQFRDSACYFNLGVIAFYQENYKTAIQNFIRVERVNVNYDTSCKVMILKSYYETDEDYDDRTLQIFRSAEKFINDNKQLSPAHKKAYKNFINVLINLYRVKHRTGKMTAESICKKIEKFELINDKRWLLEKIDELEK